MRKDRALDPRGLDVLALCRQGQALEGELPLADMARLTAGLPHAAEGTAHWQAQGEDVPVAGGEAEHWLTLQAHAQVPMQCQRCLQPMQQPLQVSRRFRFVRDEDEAAALDEELEDDVLVLQPRLDLPGLIEDELILALPLVPRHEVCPEPLVLPDDAPAAEEEAAPHPFAALAALKERGRH